LVHLKFTRLLYSDKVKSIIVLPVFCIVSARVEQVACSFPSGFLRKKVRKYEGFYGLLNARFFSIFQFKNNPL